MNILLTNDDGIHFPGLEALKHSLAELGTIYAFGPARERSATSQAMTIYDNIFVKAIDDQTFIVDGYPVDCVNIALHSGIVNVAFDLVVSGINKGVNMGFDVLYSGTVGAARHAFVHGYPALAVSCGYLDEKGNYGEVADFVKKFIREHRHELMSPGFFNINYPVQLKKTDIIKWTKLGERIYRDNYQREILGDGTMIYTLGGSQLGYHNQSGSDFAAYEEGYISVTPLQIDSTNYEKLAKLDC